MYPSHLIPFADDRVGGNGGPRIRALRGQPVEYTPPQRVVGVRASPAAKTPPPESAGRHGNDPSRSLDAGDHCLSIELARAGDELTPGAIGFLATERPVALAFASAGRGVSGFATVASAAPSLASRTSSSRSVSSESGRAAIALDNARLVCAENDPYCPEGAANVFPGRHLHQLLLHHHAVNRKIVERYEERVRCFGYSLTDLDWIGPIAE